MAHKLYISALVVLFCLGGIILLHSTVAAVHDAREYQAVPEAYRAAIWRLRYCWDYAGLPEEDQQVLLAQHKRWKDEQRLLMWEMEKLDLGPKQQEQPVTLKSGWLHDRLKKDAALATFERLVPRWGGSLHQEHPIVAVAISLLGFVPAVLVIGLAKWVRWLRA